LRTDSTVIAAEFGVLGPLLSRRDGEVVAIAGGQQRRLLAALIVAAGSVVSTDRLAAALGWEGPSEMNVRTLRTYVFRLRELLGRDVVSTQAPGYVLQVTPEQIDAGRFEALVDEARAVMPAQPARSAGLLDQALSLWRGPAYAEFADEEFARTEAARLEQLRVATEEDRFEAGLAMGAHREVVAELETFVTAHPLRERARGQLMLALYRCGRQADALATYRNGRDLLLEQLGLEPGPQLQSLERDLLRQRPELAWAEPRREEGNLPRRDLTSFVGRDRDVAAVAAALSESALVTLTGPGGVGKTRLARHVAMELGDRYPGGVWWCELAAVSGPDVVAHAVAEALGITVTRDGPVEAVLVSSLAPRHLLLVLDNCEHVLDGTSHLVEAILRGAAGVTVLATSRVRLGVAGERVWSVAPLAAPAAAELFVDRARAVRPSLELTGDSLDAVAGLCARLDGLPLAVELAAARLRSMNPVDLALRLADRFALLTTGTRNADPRHRSLRSVVEWSYALLSATERRVFQRLCVFAGTFGLNAAERVCAGAGVAAGDVPELVSGLVDASMVLVGPGDGPVRYALLETLRQFGIESATSQGELILARRRHAEYYTELAETAGSALCGPDEAAAGSLLDAELANLRVAHRWALETAETDPAFRLAAALFRYALWRLHDEVLRWAESTVDLVGAEQHPQYPVVCGMASWGCGLRGQRTTAVMYAQKGLAAASPDDPARFAPLEALGHVALWEGRLDQARRYLQDASRLVADPGDLFPAQAHALALTYDGRIDEALAIAEAGQRHADQRGSPSMRAVLRFSRGEALAGRDPMAAAALLDEALHLASTVRNRLVLGVASVSATAIRARHGDPVDALRSFRATVDLWRSTSDWTHLWIGLRGLIELLHRVQSYEPAAVLHGAVYTADTAAPPYGEDADRLSRLGRSLATQLGSSTYAAAVHRGRSMTDEQMIDYAMAEIARALARIEAFDA
jgi:predicted ATPase